MSGRSEIEDIVKHVEENKRKRQLETLKLEQKYAQLKAEAKEAEEELKRRKVLNKDEDIECMNRALAEFDEMAQKKIQEGYYKTKEKLAAERLALVNTLREDAFPTRNVVMVVQIPDKSSSDVDMDLVTPPIHRKGEEANSQQQEEQKQDEEEERVVQTPNGYQQAAPSPSMEPRSGANWSPDVNRFSLKPVSTKMLY